MVNELNYLKKNEKNYCLRIFSPIIRSFHKTARDVAVFTINYI